MAQRSGFTKIIGFDMGGTSTDVCLVEGTPTVTNEAEVAGLPVRVPMLNIHTVERAAAHWLGSMPGERCA